MKFQPRPHVGKKILTGLLLALVLPVSLAPSVSEAQVRDRYENRNRNRYEDRYQDRARRGRDRDRNNVGGWVRLGSTDVDGRRDTDWITVRQRGTFRSLMFRVTDSPVRIHDVVVRFEGGGEFRPRLRRDFGRGSGTHVIDLPGRRRDLDRITFRFSDLGDRRKAMVTVFGRR